MDERKSSPSIFLEMDYSVWSNIQMHITFGIS